MKRTITEHEFIDGFINRKISYQKGPNMSKIKEYHLKLEEEETREERRKALFGRMFGDPIASKAYYSLKRKKRD